MTDQDKLFVYFRCGFKSLLIGEHTIDMSGSNQSVHGFLTVKLVDKTVCFLFLSAILFGPFSRGFRKLVPGIIKLQSDRPNKMADKNKKQTVLSSSYLKNTLAFSVHFLPRRNKQLIHKSACVHRDMKHVGSLESTKDA